MTHSELLKLAFTNPIRDSGLTMPPNTPPPLPQPPTTTNPPGGDLTKLAIEELRLTYERLNEAYSSVKTKILTFLAADFALMSYLYGGGSFFFPIQMYGRVLYSIGLGLVTISVVILFAAFNTVFWKVPTELNYKTMLGTYPNQDAFLQFLYTEYVNALASNIPKYEQKNAYYKAAFFCLVAGGTILLVIKSFNA